MPKPAVLRIACLLLLGLSLAAAPAAATSLVPALEGEVDTGLGAPLDGGAFVALPFTITSLSDSSTGFASHLFIDRAGTANTYGPVSFLATDVGTSDASGDYWFRPSVVQTPPLETGQLEVGTFLITFGVVLPELVVRFFDTETTGTSYAVNGGVAVAVPAGADGNVHEVTLYDVSSLTLDLGQRGGSTGDGVNFQLLSDFSPVPEPTTALLALAGLAGLALAGVPRRA